MLPMARSIPSQITIADAAEILGVSRQRVRQLIDAGRLEVASRHPKLLMLDGASLKRFLRERQQSGS